MGMGEAAAATAVVVVVLINRCESQEVRQSGGGAGTSRSSSSADRTLTVLKPLANFALKWFLTGHSVEGTLKVHAFQYIISHSYKILHPNQGKFRLCCCLAGRMWNLADHIHDPDSQLTQSNLHSLRASSVGDMELFQVPIGVTNRVNSSMVLLFDAYR